MVCSHHERLGEIRALYSRGCLMASVLCISGTEATLSKDSLTANIAMLEKLLKDTAVFPK